jgi:anti-sigma regulatory factor (Ser/Thr protein kinase)
VSKSLLRWRQAACNPFTGSAGPAARFELDAQPVQVGRARGHVRQTLPGWGLDAHTELAELIVSELVTNAIVHGNPPITVTLSYAGGQLLAEVSDQGPGRPVRRRPTASDESGRGLELIDGLIALHGGTRRVTGNRNGPGKTVCVKISLSTEVSSG